MDNPLDTTRLQEWALGMALQVSKLSKDPSTQVGIVFATGPLDGCTMVVTHPCCAQCAALVIQAGIKRVMWPKPNPEFKERWANDMALSLLQFGEAGVEVVEV